MKENNWREGADVEEISSKMEVVELIKSISKMKCNERDDFH